MKGLILLQNGFEDTEALATIDVLSRAGHIITKVNMSNDKYIETQYGHHILVEDLYNDINFDNYDYLVIPGGKAVSTYLLNDERVYEAIKAFDKKKKLIACICAAPALLRDYLVNKPFTCFPGYDKYIKGIYTNKGVEKIDNYITAKSMYYSIDFALEIVKYYDAFSNLIKSLKAE